MTTVPTSPSNTAGAHSVQLPNQSVNNHVSSSSSPSTDNRNRITTFSIVIDLDGRSGAAELTKSSLAKFWFSLHTEKTNHFHRPSTIVTVILVQRARRMEIIIQTAWTWSMSMRRWAAMPLHDDEEEEVGSR